jgi:hypothetical protein
LIALSLPCVVFLNDDIFFTLLIHEEDYGYKAYTPASFHKNIYSQDTQLQPQTKLTPKKIMRKWDFGVEEDIIIVSAWLITSMDAIHGIDKKKLKILDEGSCGVWWT